MGADVTRVAVPTETRAPDGRTNAYLVGGDETLLVDPAARVERLDDAIGSLDHVAVTHTHSDHVGGVAAYARRHGATVWARTGRIERFERATGCRPDRTFEEGSQIGPTRVIETPGHAPDHVAFATEAAALVGDVAVADGSVFVGGPDGDMRAYFTTLRRLRAAGFDTLYPGHGEPIEDPNGALSRLLRHRRDRERRVLAAVREGARTTEEILDAAYEKDLAGVRDLARLTIDAHLRKLATEGRVERDGGRIRPR